MSRPRLINLHKCCLIFFEKITVDSSINRYAFRNKAHFPSEQMTPQSMIAVSTFHSGGHTEITLFFVNKMYKIPIYLSVVRKQMIFSLLCSLVLISFFKCLPISSVSGLLIQHFRQAYKIFNRHKICLVHLVF